MRVACIKQSAQLLSPCWIAASTGDDMTVLKRSFDMTNVITKVADRFCFFLAQTLRTLYTCHDC